MRIPAAILMAILTTACVVPEEGGARDDTAQLEQAFHQRSSNLAVEAEGVVTRVLRDDTQGSRHQRFLLRLSSGQTVLVAHNIDLAPRVEDIQVGERVRFHGEYEWNEQGGVIHWTHADSDGSHAGGWLQRGGRRYD